MLNKIICLSLIFSVLAGFTSCKNNVETESEKASVEHSYIDKETKDWPILGFERTEGVNPVLSPIEESGFYSELNNKDVKWESNDVFNPAATVMGDSIYVLYRAEDKSGKGISERTSRIGLAVSANGFEMKRLSKPVLFPRNDDQKEFEWPGGCEDPRVAVTEDGTYVMLYTQWNKKVARLAVATSKNLKE
jgi:predicted GH43/DUF377 family glycosyl hydrolase